MNAHASNLDIEKFRKVHALITGGATDGERAAAKARAEAMAARAGLSLLAAIRSMHDKDEGARTTTAHHNPFADVFNSPEMRADRAERERKNEIKRKIALKEYGSITAIFDPTPWEIALRKAIEPFSLLMPYACKSGVERLYTQIMDGEMAGDFVKGTPRSKAAIANAYPMPTTIAEAMAEVKFWNKIRWDRGLFIQPYGYDTESEVSVRVEMVERFLAEEPVKSWQDMEDRFAWKRYEFASEYLDPVERNDPFMDRVEDDFRILRTIGDTPHEPDNVLHGGARAQTGHAQFERRTNAAKAGDVKDLLQSSPELSNREIGRRIGVSPQTVANWRERIAQADMASEGRMEA